MKKTLLVCAAFALILASCGSDDEGDKKQSEKKPSIDYSGMSEASLDTFHVDLKFMVPEYEGAMNLILPYKLEEVDEGSKWKVTISKGDRIRYALYIEDAKLEYEMAKEEGRELDLVAVKKEELSQVPFYSVKFIQEDPNFLLYEISIPDDQTIKPQYHVFGVVPGNETVYKVYSDELVSEFTQLNRTEDMLKTIQSMLELNDKKEVAAN